MKRMILFLLVFLFVALNSEEIIVYRQTLENVTGYYTLDDVKIGLYSSGEIKGEVLARFLYDKSKNYYIATAMEKENLSSLNNAVYSNMEKSFAIIEERDAFANKSGWELFKMTFKNPIKNDFLYDYNPISFSKSKSFKSETDSLINIISPDTLYDYIAILSGELPYPQGTYSQSRVVVTSWVDTAAVYLKTVMDSMGFDSVYFENFSFSSDSTYNTKNVVGLKRGNLSHDTCIVIGAHYDDYSPNYADAPGADDNASGSAGVLEAARALMGIESDYDIYFICFSGEEWGLYGSEYFVNDYIIPNNMHVLGMVNFDMIGYNPSASYQYDLYGMTHSAPLKNIFNMMADTFTTLVTHTLGSSAGSDHYPFDIAGFKAAFAIEYDFSPVYHSPHDTIALLNFDFMKEIVQAGTATVFYLSQMPLPVTEFSLIDNGDSSISVSWTKTINTDIEKYRVYYKKTGDISELIFDAGDTTAATVPSLSPGVLYTFRITPIDSTGIEAFSEATDTITPSFAPNIISVIDAYGDNSNIYLSFHKSNAGDFEKFRIYRKIGAGAFSLADSTTDTVFTDAALTDTSIFRYYVTAVDNDGYESFPSETLATRLVSLVKGLFVIDETNNGGVATDIATDAFYDTMMGNVIYDIIDADSISQTSILQFGLYERILYIDDDLTSNKIDYEDLYRYLNAGGKAAIIGWNIGKSILENPAGFPAYAESNSLQKTIFGIDYYNRCTYNQLDYINYSINGNTDTIRFVESKLPRGSNGNLLYGGVFGLTSESHPLGFYHSTVGDTAFDSKPIIFSNADTTAVIVAAPLFYMNTADAKNLVKNILALFGDLSAVCIENKMTLRNSISIESDMKSIKIIFSTNSGEKINISLIDITGRIIEKKSILPSGNMQILSVGENIQSGVYFIKIDLGKDSVLKKAMLIK